MSVSRRTVLAGSVATGLVLPVMAGAQQRPAAPAARPAARAAPPPPPPEPTQLPNGYPWIQTAAQFAYVVDFETGRVLLDKNSEQRMFPSSMTKMMTAFIVFEKLARGELQLTETFTVSERAWRQGGSKMFVEVNTRVSIENLLRGIIVHSGNDACIVLAEGLAGSEEAFASLMNAKAAEIGMTGTQYRNSMGWPDPNHWTTARDLAVLADQTIRRFPQFYPMYAEREFRWGNMAPQPNRNPLLAMAGQGADGLKTGHTDASGFGLTGSAVRDGRRVILVINGLTSMRQRGEEAGRLMDFAYSQFENLVLFRPGETITEAAVWQGEQRTLPLVAARPLIATIPRRVRRDIAVRAVFDEPVVAPIQQVQTIGKLVVSAPSVETVELPLIAGASVDRLGPIGRVGAAVSHFVFGSR
ncbi:MAG: D-alanyl-D-alanine carboxypeptidase family protein [Alphaproteobacteria bacterium]|nr:D-alanyl-D-alanine carboxypeptidase family protein [Alphaproteobacteria bacterium]